MSSSGSTPEGQGWTPPADAPPQLLAPDPEARLSAILTLSGYQASRRDTDGRLGWLIYLLAGGHATEGQLQEAWDQLAGVPRAGLLRDIVQALEER